VRRAAEHGESGQALAEVAIALPLLLLMLIGIWEFARAYQIQQVVVNAAREGAREVVLPPKADGTGTVANATTVVNNYLAGGSVPCDACITITPADETLHTTGATVTVRVSVPYSFNLIGPMIRLATGNSGGPGDINLTSRATMRHE
jgi:Flp pilus assembly protein TadG